MLANRRPISRPRGLGSQSGAARSSAERRYSRVAQPRRTSRQSGASISSYGRNLRTGTRR